jgi:hypothetical protein
MNRPEFAKQMFAFWRDTFKMGETAMLDTAPAFAARLSVNNGSYMDMFTASSDNCPTFDANTGTFTSGECTNGGGRVNFQDTAAVICANCHSTLNHLTPLFANYDEKGDYQTAIAVPTPLDGAPLAKLSDYLPEGETTAWRLGKPAADLTELGTVMAADPAVAECGVARIWNWALGKTDIVDTLQEVPTDTIKAQIDAFAASGYKLKDMIYAVYTSDDFVKF